MLASVGFPPRGTSPLGRGEADALPGDLEAHIKSVRRRQDVIDAWATKASEKMREDEPHDHGYKTGWRLLVSPERYLSPGPRRGRRHTRGALLKLLRRAFDDLETHYRWRLEVLLRTLSALKDQNKSKLGLHRHTKRDSDIPHTKLEAHRDLNVDRGTRLLHDLYEQGKVITRRTTR